MSTSRLELEEIPGEILRLRVKNYAVLIIAPRDPGYTYLEHMLHPETYSWYRKDEVLTVKKLLGYIIDESKNPNVEKVKLVVETRKGIYLFKAVKGKAELVTYI